MLCLGSKLYKEPLEIVFSFIDGAYNTQEDFSELKDLGITICETTWKKITKTELNFIHEFNNSTVECEWDNYQIPMSGRTSFLDCDLWLLISDRTAQAPLAPICPYGVVVYDYIQRYVPEIFCDVANATELNYFQTVRNAQFVITTTPQTQNDVIQYAGVASSKVHLLPIEFAPPKPPNSVQVFHGKNYFVWVTNVSYHKNQLRTFRALEKYYGQLNGQLDCIILGTYTEIYTDPIKASSYPFWTHLSNIFNKSAILKQRCHTPGEVSDQLYSNYLAQSQFLLHPVLFDNGTYSVIEAAYLNTPSTSSNYPAMQYMNQHFHLNLCFFDPYSIDDMAKKLKIMEETCADRKTQLPSKDSLDMHSAERLGPQLWEWMKQYL